jgi:ribose 5-phosphate isomerase B
MKIAVGGDHAGFPMKGPVIEHLRSRGHDVTDHGAYSLDPVDFPDVSAKVCEAVLSGEAERGVLVCGTGVGAAIAANKIPGIRAALSHDIHTAHQGVEHDDVNVICVGAWIVGIAVVKEILDAFIAAEFSTDPDFRRRVNKLHQMERNYAKKLLSNG